jgi:hypothetical protein
MPKNSQLFIDIGPNMSLVVGLPKIASWNTQERPRKPKRGTVGFNLQTKSLEYYNGSDWFTAPLSTA